MNQVCADALSDREEEDGTGCIAFEGARKIGAGTRAEVALAVKAVVDRGERGPVLIFDRTTSQQIELDLRGTHEEILARFAPPAAEEDGKEAHAPTPRGPGRPKLGVVSREITLLPRHWAWLASQPGSASVTLRKLVDQARKANEEADRRRQARDAAYGFISTMAGNEAGFEEATRALFAGDGEAFARYIKAWPEDVLAHTEFLTREVFDG